MTRVTRLSLSLDGAVIAAEDPTYDDARRLHNSMIDRRPAVIAQCASPDDVATAVRFAREQGLEVAVRGGGHSVAGTSLTDGGLVVDLRRLNSVEVDPVARTARVGGGARMTDLDRGTEPHRLAVTGGRVSTIGVGGFTLGGGTGWLDRKFGLACDNLVSVDLVTADGLFLTASEKSHPELFWALHGGGGNFGVATSLTFRLHDLPVSSVALLIWEPEDALEPVRAFRDIIDGAPDDVTGGVIYVIAPPEDFIPEHLVGKLVCLVVLICLGTEAQLRSEAEPLLDLGPAVDLLTEMPYADIQCLLDDEPGNRNYWSAEHLAALPDAAVDVFHKQAFTMVQPSLTQHVLFAAGGAAARSLADHPVSWRTAPWVVHPFAVWTDSDQDAAQRDWTRKVRAAMQPWSTGAVYLNFIGEEGIDRVRAGFGEAAWRRLVEHRPGVSGRAPERELAVATLTPHSAGRHGLE